MDYINSSSYLLGVREYFIFTTTIESIVEEEYNNLALFSLMFSCKFNNKGSLSIQAWQIKCNTL